MCIRDSYTAEHGALVEYKPEFKMRPHFENEINAFVDCVKTGKKLQSHIDTVIITAKMMQAIYDSAEQHREVCLLYTSQRCFALFVYKESNIIIRQCAE